MLGYAGKRLLVVNLSKGTTEAMILNDDMLERTLGGRGLGAQLLYDLCPPKAKAFDPAVPFMVLTGPVNGTPVVASSKHVVITKSPATGGWVDSYASGHVAAHLKYAGWDGLIVLGRSEKPCYIQIENERVQVKDASFLWGKDAFETEKWLRENVSERGGKMTIGPAGENRIQFACINSDFYRQTGRAGAGAVMGAKKIKAILVNGSGGIPIADSKGLLAKLQEVTQMVNQSLKSQNFAKYGTNMVVGITNNAGMLPTHNFQHGIFPDAAGRLDKDGFYPLKTGDHACSGCVMPCAKIIEMKTGRYGGSRLEAPEYESIAMLGSNLGIDDTAFVTEANLLCNQLGLDTISMGNVLGFAMECYERGLLTREQTDGCDLYFGNKKEVLHLIEKTAKLEGFGALLAQGVQKMAKKIGKEAEHYAMHVKGVELPGYDPRGAFGAALTYAVNPRGGCHRRAWPPQKEVVGDVPPYTVEGKAEMIMDMFNERIIPHHFIVCDFYLNMVPVSLGFYAECLSLVTGREFTVERLQWIAERTETLIRMFNCREGLGRKDDKTPDRILEETLAEGAAKGQRIGKEGFEKMLNEYYALRGWDENGVPKSETLAKYELNL